MSALRRANPTSVDWRERLANLSSDRIEGTTISSTAEEGLFSGYPYEGQEVLKGEFDYLLETVGGGTRPIKMSFYYRTATGLFVILPGPRDQLLSEALKEVRRTLHSDFRILPGLSAKTSGVWELIDDVRWTEIEIQHKDTTYLIETEADFEEIRNEIGEPIIGEKRIIKANLVFEWRGHDIQADFLRDSISIFSENGGGVPNLEEYPELDEDARFVLQKLEKYVLTEG